MSQQPDSGAKHSASTLADTTPVRRTAKDKVIIALLAVVLIALVVGVMWGVRYVMTAMTAERQDAQEMASRPVPAMPGELAVASSRADAADDANTAANTQASDASFAGTPAAGTGEAVPEIDPQVGDAAQQGVVAQGEEDATGDPQAADPEEVPANPAAQGDADAQAVEAEPVEGVEADPTAPVDPAAEAGVDSAQDPAAQADPAAADSTDPAASASTDGIASVASSSRRDASASADALANLPDNPIDFAALQEDNEDIYAWLYIPNTGINLPVLQSPFDDAYYLTHDPDRNEDVYGSVFSQLANKKDFTDPVTVLYGHDGEGQFKNLHYFEDEEFFAQNELLYVYTPGHILTYRVVAAYKYDNRHILNSFDFADPVVLQQYYDSVLNPDSLLLNVREGATLDATKDKIIQMSTCMLDEFHGSSRYVVTGVLVDDELTK